MAESPDMPRFLFWVFFQGFQNYYMLLHLEVLHKVF